MGLNGGAIDVIATVTFLATVFAAIADVAVLLYITLLAIWNLPVLTAAVSAEICYTTIMLMLLAMNMARTAASAWAYYMDEMNQMGAGGGGTGGGSGRLTIIEGGNYSESERKAAQYMANQGYDVTLSPPVGTRTDGGTSDLVVNGVNYDVYTPTTSNPSAIISAIAKKNNQTTGIVLDLSNTTVTVNDLGDILARVKGAIEKNAGICNINDIVVMPK